MIGKMLAQKRINMPLMWRYSAGIRGYCLIAVLVAVLFGSALLLATDAYSAYVIRSSRLAVRDNQQQVDSLFHQLDKIEHDIKQRQITHQQIYDSVLQREGRLSEKHIVGFSDSRLVSSAGRRPGVSRSQPRYSPYTFPITMPSAVTVYELEQVLADSGLTGLGRAFVQAELVHGVNAVFLTALAIHESHWGQSQLARDKHNLFGFGAFDTDPYHFAESFSSKPECIMRVASHIRRQYSDRDSGSGQTIADINRLYATDSQWSEKVFRLMLELDAAIVQNTWSPL